jgi:hypothetical protein
MTGRKQPTVARRRRLELRRSLRSPHPESLVNEDLTDWARSLPAEDIESLVDLRQGTPVRWIFGRGWVKERK